MSPRPHPILKRDSSPFKTPTLPFSNCGPLFSPHVHFPPTPRIAATYPAHSPTTYDRAPIVVSPNVCQLPRRGERTVCSPRADSEEEHRGRSRSRSRGRGRGDNMIKGSYFHPRAYEACKPEPLNVPSATEFNLPSPPPLIQDLSPSDESDETVTTPPHPSSSASLANSIPLHFASAPAPRRPLTADKADFGSPPPVAGSSPPVSANDSAHEAAQAESCTDREASQPTGVFVFPRLGRGLLRWLLSPWCVRDDGLCNPLAPGSIRCMRLLYHGRL